MTTDKAVCIMYSVLRIVEHESLIAVCLPIGKAVRVARVPLLEVELRSSLCLCVSAIYGMYVPHSHTTTL